MHRSAGMGRAPYPAPKATTASRLVASATLRDLGAVGKSARRKNFPLVGTRGGFPLRCSLSLNHFFPRKMLFHWNARHMDKEREKNLIIYVFR